MIQPSFNELFTSNILLVMKVSTIKKGRQSFGDVLLTYLILLYLLFYHIQNIFRYRNYQYLLSSRIEYESAIFIPPFQLLIYILTIDLSYFIFKLNTSTIRYRFINFLLRLHMLYRNPVFSVLSISPPYLYSISLKEDFNVE